MGELVLRDSFDVIWGCANSRPGRLGVPEVTGMDGPGFSLCAVPLESLGPGFWGAQRNGRGMSGSPEYSRPERDGEDLVSKRS